MSDERNEFEVRRQKLETLRKEGFDYPNFFKPTHQVKELIASYNEFDKAQLEELEARAEISGRVVLRRDMGKASFATLAETGERIQIYVRQDEIGDEAYDRFKHLMDIGDIVSVSGILMKTNRGELTVQASDVQLVSKALQPLPEKFHGIADQEFKYRRRYVDLIVNEDSRRVFQVRSQVLTTLRDFFKERGYIEVETPMLHSIPGGATAKPFVTHHNALSRDLYLRIAPELYLKRLVVGGIERVFEINRNFRNEGLSTRHSPEFTMLEFYETYSTYEDLIELTQQLLLRVSREALGSDTVIYDGQELDFAQPAEQITMLDAVAREVGEKTDVLRACESARQLANQLGITTTDSMDAGVILNEIFEERVQGKLQQPTFITQYPASISPLARRNPADPEFTDRFELFVVGRELANGFSELNDPDDQRERFEAQSKLKQMGDEEAMGFDEDYLTALEYGMPPTAGEGIGIDRLVMLLTNSQTIRDVVLFPQLRDRTDA